MPLLIIVGIALGVGVFAILMMLGRPTRESVVLAEVTGQARSESPRQWLQGDFFAKPFVWFRGLFGGQPNSSVARRLALAGLCATGNAQQRENDGRSERDLLHGSPRFWWYENIG